MAEAMRFERPAAYCAALALAATIAGFASGARAQQPVNPPIVMPPPTFNPSTPYTVPQPPPVPVSPTLPSGLGSGAAPASPAIVSPPAAREQTTAAKPAAPRAQVRHHRKGHARSAKRHARIHIVRMRGPSYYPGLGLVPPTVDPCHFRRKWSGYDAGYPTYTCSW